MLSHISISNYTIVSELEMEFSAGMTVVTGETGAGKSIMLDALGLCLGDRADPKTIRHGCGRAEISASFDLSAIPKAKTWLASRDLGGEDEVILRRVVTAEGRSRAYINGSAATLQDCAELGHMLIDIHSQHAHQSLLRKATQRQLLDNFGNHQQLIDTLEQLASDWLRARRELELLTGSADEHSAREQLLAYQVEELDSLDLQDKELASLEGELKQLSNAEAILQSTERALSMVEEQETALHRSLQLLDPELHQGASIAAARELLDSAAIAVSEARGEIQAHAQSIEISPERLSVVERRLEAIYDIARKHKVMPEAVPALHQQLREELQSLADGGERIEQLQLQMSQLQQDYASQANKLSKKRQKAAKALEQAASEILATLAMEQCLFAIALTPRESSDPHPQGQEEVEFLISTNPGSSPQPLAKIASGGELSRISLAIQVVTATAGTVPSMVFDEVDVGIGGAVAETVGMLLQQLGENAQVLCVTHLPQVAAKGRQHLQVVKTSDENSVRTTLIQLDAEQRRSEIARMLGGIKITEQTLAHAQEMLQG